MSPSNSANIGPVAFIGFGEAGQAFAAGWKATSSPSPASITVFDIKMQDSATRPQKLAEYETMHVTGRDSSGEALREAKIIFSMVTADQAFVAAEQAATAIQPDALFFDCNSCAPSTKQKSSQMIQAAGAHYVDVAVMAPVHPALHKTPVSISSPVHARALETMAALGMQATHAPGEIGTASSIKMIRSIMVKGMEALVLECFLSAKLAGVEAEVFASLARSYPDFDWEKRVPYMLNRSMVHGTRRAEEMREVALTVETLGLPNPMANATSNWHQRIGAQRLTPQSSDVNLLAEQILNSDFRK